MVRVGVRVVRSGVNLLTEEEKVVTAGEIVVSVFFLLSQAHTHTHKHTHRLQRLKS